MSLPDRAIGLALLSLVSHQAAAQTLVVPPNVTPAPGSTFTTVTINAGGNLTADGITIRPGGGQGGVTDAVGGASGIGVFTNTTIDLGTGGGVRGIVASGTGAVITMGAGSSVISQGGGGGNFGVLVTNGATVNFIDGAFINMAGGGGSAEVQTSSNGFFDMTGGSLIVSGGGGNGIRAGDDSTPGGIRLNGTTVTVLGSGGNSAGVWANIAGSTAELINTTITVSGVGGGNFGVKATQGADATVTGGSILVNATGGNNFGVQVRDSGSSATVTNADVTVTNSDASLAAQVDGAGASLTASNSNFLVTGANGTGLQLANGGTANVTTGSIVNSGAGGQAILVSGSGQNNGTFNGTQVNSINSYGIVARDSMSSNLNFSNGATGTGGNGTLLLNQTNNASSVVNLTGTNDVVFTGDVDARGGNGTTNVTLAGNTSLTGAVNLNQLTGAAGIEPAEPVTGLPRMNVNMDIDSTSVWNMRTSSTVNTLNVDPGARIIFPVSSAGASSFRTLALNRLTGTGGIFRMDVNLGAIRGDLVHIQTSSQGDHSVDLTNVSPASDLPVNTGLLVVRTPDGVSTYSGGVDGGVFRYAVVRGDGSSIIPNTTDWYLVRLDDVPPDPDGPDGPDGPVPPVDALTPPANAAIGTFSSTFTLFHADLYLIEERLAELRMARRELPLMPKDYKESKEIKEVQSTSRPSNGFWVRGVASNIEIDTRQSREFDQLLGGGEIGFDRRFDVGGGDLYVGAFAGYLRATRDFHDGGEGTTNALNVGLYGEWYHPSGWFVDLVIKHTYLWNDFSAPTSTSLVDGDYTVPTFGGMLAIGKRWNLGNTFIEPYGSLAGGWADSVDYEMSNGLVVHAGEQTSLRGRLGVRVGLHWEYANGQVLEPYARVGAMNEFLGDNHITMNQFEFTPRFGGAVVEASAGIAARLNQSFSVYAEYSYASGDKIRSPWAGNLGMRWEW